MSAASNVLRVPDGTWTSTVHQTVRELREQRLRRAARECEDALRDYYRADQILLRVASIAAVTDTPEETVRHWLRTGLLPAVRIGRNVYVEREALLAFVEQHRET